MGPKAIIEAALKAARGSYVGKEFFLTTRTEDELAKHWSLEDVAKHYQREKELETVFKWNVSNIPEPVGRKLAPKKTDLELLSQEIVKWEPQYRRVNLEFGGAGDIRTGLGSEKGHLGVAAGNPGAVLAINQTRDRSLAGSNSLILTGFSRQAYGSTYLTDPYLNTYADRMRVVALSRPWDLSGLTTQQLELYMTSRHYSVYRQVYIDGYNHPQLTGRKIRNGAYGFEVLADVIEGSGGGVRADALRSSYLSLGDPTQIHEYHLKVRGYYRICACVYLSSHSDAVYFRLNDAYEPSDDLFTN